MSSRIKFLIQKRTSLKSQITTLAKLMENSTIDNAALKLRNARLTVLYNAFEEFHDELMLLDDNEVHTDEFAIIQERFYALVGWIENTINAMNLTEPSTSRVGKESQNSQPENSNACNKKRRLKLSEATLPTFDGKFENWLSFKNAFGNIIDSQSDLSEIDKLHY